MDGSIVSTACDGGIGTNIGSSITVSFHQPRLKEGESQCAILVSVQYLDLGAELVQAFGDLLVSALDGVYIAEH